MITWLLLIACALLVGLFSGIIITRRCDMGMFDEVNFEMDCPKCGERVLGFQSKDFLCQLQVVDPQYVVRMYATCPNCHKWIKLVRQNDVEDPNRRRQRPYTLEEVKVMGFKIVDGD